MHHVPRLRAHLAAIWHSSIETPLRQVFDFGRVAIDRMLTRYFFGTRSGRWLFNHTTPNDWTMVRLYLSWIPMVLILTGRPMIALTVWFPVWSTDFIDGWLAKKKQQASESGAKLETTVDTIFLLQTFIGAGIMYDDIRHWLGLAGLLEIVRLIGGLILRRRQYAAEPNRSGRAKTWAYAVGTGLQLVAWPKLAQLVLGLGIALSIYSMLMHLKAFAAQRPRKQSRH
ncbi:MAG: CDP-alcohol phosphatidyltransferase family protein [Candidatus Kerfeldbacteria bacterium]|nr:CDP-alcohol phosphatidyltransferase family protein [Candidatus Kerfeldbacteria bacterium]